MAEEFIYKREVNKSVLYDGFGIDREYLPVLLSRMPPLQRGEKKSITLLFCGKEYSVEFKNLNNPQNRRKNDAYQIRYTPNSEFVKALQQVFFRTYQYVQAQRNANPQEAGRQFTAIPDEIKEYLVFYTTAEPTVLVCEPIVHDDLRELKKLVTGQDERSFETAFSLDVRDDSSAISRVPAIVPVRKLNRKIGDALKEHYRCRCQICGQCIGEKYGSRVVEAHHIDYFVKSMNNDMGNILIVCPNHHGIIHDRNPIFHRANCTFEYPNGYTEGLALNDHLGK